MLFNSYTFLGFFACVLVLHHLPLPWRVRKLNLLWASYLFYAAWNPPFVVLLWISTVVDWFIARWLYRSRTQATRSLLLTVSLAVNLGMLGFFKYGNFLFDNFVLIAESIGISYQPARPDIILPVGISFYTFQTLSYTLDIYRGKARPWHSFLDYALYVTFFPQLVAGPIVRSDDFLPQCLEPRKATGSQLSWGISLLVIGLFEKVVIADGLLADAVEHVYGACGKPDFISAWGATVAFAGQIFCDFAGYSTCAIGTAMCLGFRVPDNFRFPYAAVGFSDFWRRWHISLSSWLRDYLYISLGGNRKGRFRTNVNLMVTMLIGGLWHGASWTFVIWGGLHGIYLVVERVIRGRIPDTQKPVRPVCMFGLAMITFVLGCFAWVFFRASSFQQAFGIISAMLGTAEADAERCIWEQDLLFVVLAMVPMLSVHWCLRDHTLEDAASRIPWLFRSAILAIMLLAIATMGGGNHAFIYFQF